MAYTSPDNELILVLDFGAQYTQLIARRIRECSVYCEIIGSDTPVDTIRARAPKGLVLSGTPREQLDMMTFLKPEGCLYHVRVGSREEAAAFEREVAAIHRAKRSVTVVNPLP